MSNIFFVREKTPNSLHQIMILSLLKSKIHCATVTEANLHYMGSITIDEALLEAAGLIAGEHVHVVNNMNGKRSSCPPFSSGR